MQTELDAAIDRHIDLKLALQGKSTSELREIILRQADRINLYRAQLEKLSQIVGEISRTL